MPIFRLALLPTTEQMTWMEADRCTLLFTRIVILNKIQDQDC